MTKNKKIREKKVRIVQEIADSLGKSQVVVITSYSGMKTADMTSLRRKLRAAGVDYRVVKNTLARFAADETGKGFDRNVFDGPIAAAFGYDDPVLAAKILNDFAKGSDSPLSILGGILGESVLTAEQVKELAQLPSREVLLARVVGGIQSPLVGFVRVLSGPVRGLAYLLQARIKQLEEA